jgi:hypothetical protein
MTSSGPISDTITQQASLSLLYNEEHDLHVEHSIVWITAEVPVTVAPGGVSPSTIYMKIKYVSNQLPSKQAVDDWIERALVDIRSNYPVVHIKAVNITKRM